MNFDTQRGLTAPLSQIVFEQYSRDGRMAFEQFQSMCADKGFCEDVEDEEMAAAFVRMSGEPAATKVSAAFESGIEYSEFLAWWKLQDERQKGLKFKSTEEKEFVQRVKKSFFQGTGGCARLVRLVGPALNMRVEQLRAQAFAGLDKDGSGYIDFPEYLRWRQEDDRFSHLLHDASDQHSQYIHQVGEFFRAYDEELTGQLSIEQFRPLYDSLVEQGEVQEAFDKVLQEVDSNSDGSVSLNEFIKWYATTWEDPVESEEDENDA
ncbi:CCM1 [Symbiodinium natans]|uniref:CCM1 protein n=1 Tax=Symbiodinium natans TaxID=878477 RepID=A0A812G9A1_9DINO|nr:CCM1 [Symbiodinium natans]